MTQLTGKQIANTYKQLLKVGVSTNSGVCATSQTIQSGDGANSAMQLSTTAIRSTGAVEVDGNISATGNIHSGGNVCATRFYGSGAHLTSVSAALFSTSIDSFTANRLHVVTAASIQVLEVKACASLANLVAPTGSFTTKVSGVAAEFSGNVCASEFYGDGSNLTNIAAATSVASMTINTLGVVTAASITSLVAPHGSFTTKVSGVAAEFSGNVCASEYYGDGSNLTNLPTASTSVASFTVNQLGVVTAASITSLVAPHGSFTTKVSGVAAEFSGNVCASEYYGDGSNLTGITTGTSAASYTINRLHVVTAASITGTLSVEGGAWLNGGVVFNEPAADVDFRVESGSITDILKVDAGDDTTRIKGFIYEQQVISASVSSATHTVDLSKANVYDLTFLNDCSLAFSNVAPAGRAQDFTVIIRRTAVASVSFDPIVLTAGGVTLGLGTTSGRTDVLTMFTVDGGTSFYTASSFLDATTVAA